ncbi:DUF3301 domain-containing protein [Shewanella sp. OPT22]|uniref:DUF3301 domain-containing protein n=1 Tax=Parashewanella hymeniacidonis TaxID=2807618 RepID=UPI00101F85FE|nr:DUF3301 domain-containing protein [Parashewanella hymeniacidonis]MBM7073031.1 DUF3301 domain-containing protein [Parashewanella hymeniacidonis]RYV03243.1 DUF3301 domain-containing protein [Shewanella sp. OPT22]
MMTDLLLILGIALIAAFFWQLRQMAETSRRFSERESAKQRVQLLSVAMSSARPSLGGSTGLCWKATFLLEFSTDGINRYQAEFVMLHNRIISIDWPVFPEPDWMEAPASRGKIGGCCGSHKSCSTNKG